MKNLIKTLLVSAALVGTVGIASAATSYYGGSGQYLGNSTTFGNTTSFYGGYGQYLGNATRF